MILHWLVGPHPWTKTHARGIAWLLVVVGLIVSAFTFWTIAAGWIVPTGCDKSGCNNIPGLTGLGAGFVALPSLIVGLRLTWQAEERRLNRAKDAEKARLARADRIHQLEKEAGIVD